MIKIQTTVGILADGTDVFMRCRCEFIRTAYHISSRIPTRGTSEFDPTTVISKKDKANELKAIECAKIGHMHQFDALLAV